MQITPNKTKLTIKDKELKMRCIKKQRKKLKRGPRLQSYHKDRTNYKKKQNDHRDTNKPTNKPKRKKRWSQLKADLWPCV